MKQLLGFATIAFLFTHGAEARRFELAQCGIEPGRTRSKYSELFQRATEVRAPLLMDTLLIYECFQNDLKNTGFVTIVDYKLHSSKKRLFVLNIKTQNLESFLTAHGRGSDPKHTGFAEIFSDTPQSKASSLGYYTTAEIYRGGHGKTLALDGRSSTNGNARKRSVVIHGAAYVDPRRKKMGRSWGCPSLAFSDLNKVVDRIKGGSLLAVFN